jgi:hypothetical protein
MALSPLAGDHTRRPGACRPRTAADRGSHHDGLKRTLQRGGLRTDQGNQRNDDYALAGDYPEEPRAIAAEAEGTDACTRQHTSAYVSIREQPREEGVHPPHLRLKHTSAYVSVCLS